MQMFVLCDHTLTTLRIGNRWGGLSYPSQVWANRPLQYWSMYSGDAVPGETPLHFACSLGSRETVDYLLAHGARAGVADEYLLSTPCPPTSPPLAHCMEHYVNQSRM
jgi:hypothetical protein